MSLIQFNNVSFCYEGNYDNVFTDISFILDTDWKTGIIGRNGRGKTTLLKLLMNKYKYQGSIINSTPLDYFPFVIEDKSKLTLDIITELYPDYEFWRLCIELNELGIDTEVLNRSFSTMSNGEQTKVMLAVLFSKENNFLLIDEPTNHLDIESRELVKNYLNSKKSFILVSHDRDFLDGCVNHILSINPNEITVEKGNFSSWKLNKDRQDQFELERNESLKKEIRRLENSARKTAQRADEIEGKKIGKNAVDRADAFINTRSYQAVKSRKLQQRRKNLNTRQQNAIQEKSSLLKNIEHVDDIRLVYLKHHKQVLCRADNLALYYGERCVASNIKFELNQGERFMVIGKNGSGKSTLLKAIIQPDSIKTTGTLELPSDLVISYVPQDTSFLNGTLKKYIEENVSDETLFKSMLRKLGFSREQFDKTIENFSSGQKKKLLIAKSLCEQAHLYIWDEPLNYIDIFSRMQIEELVLNHNSTIIMVEHDRAFANRIATNTIVLSND